MTLRQPETADRARQYCREARRARARWANDRQRMHRTLTELSRREDCIAAISSRHHGHRRMSIPVSVTRVVADSDANSNSLDERMSSSDERMSSSDEFTRLIESHLMAGVLTYSSRRALLESAPQFGIRRFEANLLIAAAQHQQGNAQPVVGSEPQAARQTKPSRWLGYFRWPELLAMAALQVAIGLWLWYSIG